MKFEIVSIELSGFTGMWLNDIKYFKMTVNEVITLILGRNGSGKSRLMKQLTPMAPSKSDFYDGGWRELIVKTDITYRLRCGKKGKDLKCSIYNVTEDLVICENANPTVYNRWVSELFQYNKDFHDLVTGATKLTSMDTPERKRWFSLLSESDLTYALKFYKCARVMQRDVSGSIKLLKRSIGELRPKILDREDDFVALGARIDLLQSDIGIIAGKLNDTVTDRSITDRTLEELDTNILKIHKEVVGMTLWVSEGEDQFDIKELERRSGHLVGKREGLLKSLEDLEQRIARASSLHALDLPQLEEQRAKLYDHIATEKEWVVSFPELLDLDSATLRQAHLSSNSMTSALSDAMNILDTDLPVDGCRKRLSDLKDFSSTLNKKWNEITNREARLTATLKHIEGVCDTACPKCRHTFKPGIDEDAVEETKAALTFLHDESKLCQQQMSDTSAEIEQYYAIVQATDTILNVIRHHRDNAANAMLFSYMSNSKGFFKAPKRHIGMLGQHAKEVGVALDIANAKDRISALSHDIALAEATASEDTEHLTFLKDNIENELYQHASEEQLVKAQLEAAQAREHTLNRATELEGLFEQQVKERDRVAEVLLSNLYRQSLEEHNAALWSLLTVAKQRYADMDKERQKLAFQEEQLEINLQRYESLSQTVKAMSPDEGILAKYLYNCINRITELMTHYISQIWGYGMQIRPCEIVDGEIDYKFPYWIKNEGREARDVSEASTGQKEIFDFVFVLSVYRAKGLEGYPLLVDETGSGFDEGHRNELISFLKDLLSKGHHSQCFMVSHDAGSHFKLTHAGVVVIDPEGIDSLPSVYNTNVTIV